MNNNQQTFTINNTKSRANPYHHLTNTKLKYLESNRITFNGEIDASSERNNDESNSGMPTYRHSEANYDKDHTTSNTNIKFLTHFNLDKSLQIKGFDYQEYNYNYFVFFELYKYYLKERNHELLKILEIVHKYFDELINIIKYGKNKNNNYSIIPIFIQDKLNVINHQDIKSYYIFISLYHYKEIYVLSKPDNEYEIKLYKEIVQNLKIFILYIFSRKPDYYDKDIKFETYNEINSMMRSKYYSFLKYNPILYFDLEATENSDLYTIILDTIDKNLLTNNEFFYNKFQNYIQLNPKDYIYYLKLIDYDINYNYEYKLNKIDSERSVYYKSKFESMLTKIDEKYLFQSKLFDKSKIILKLIYEVKAKFYNIQYLIDYDSNPMKGLIICQSYYQLYLVSDRLKYYLRNHISKFEDLKILSIANGFSLKNKKYDYIKFKIRFEKYKIQSIIKIFLFTKYDYDNYNLITKSKFEFSKQDKYDSFRKDLKIYSRYISYTINEPIIHKTKINNNKDKTKFKHLQYDHINPSYKVIFVLIFLWILFTSIYTLSRLLLFDINYILVVNETNVNFENSLAITNKLNDKVLKDLNYYYSTIQSLDDTFDLIDNNAYLNRIYINSLYSITLTNTESIKNELDRKSSPTRTETLDLIQNYSFTQADKFADILTLIDDKYLEIKNNDSDNFDTSKTRMDSFKTGVLQGNTRWNNVKTKINNTELNLIIQFTA